MIADWVPGQHVCQLFATDEVQRDVVASYLKQGFDRHEKVLYVPDQRDPKAALEWLGPDAEAAHDSGQFAVVAKEAVYLRGGQFDSDATIDFFRKQAQAALAEGYAALRSTAEMSWAFAANVPLDRLFDYESRANALFAEAKVIALCQYDCRRFEPGALIDVLRTHPWAVAGSDLHPNPYHVPHGLPTLDAWLDGLKREKSLHDNVKRLTNEMLRLQTRLEMAGDEEEAAPTMKTSDLLTLVLGLELRWQQQYTRMAAAILNSNPTLSETLRGMSYKEAFHRKRLEEHYRKTHGKPPPSEEPASVPAMLQSKTRFTFASVEKLVDSGRKALALAVKMEQESIDVYKWIASINQDFEFQRVCSALCAGEESQLEQLKPLAGIK